MHRFSFDSHLVDRSDESLSQKTGPAHVSFVQPAEKMDPRHLATSRLRRTKTRPRTGFSRQRDYWVGGSAHLDRIAAATSR